MLYTYVPLLHLPLLMLLLLLLLSLLLLLCCYFCFVISSTVACRYCFLPPSSSCCYICCCCSHHHARCLACLLDCFLPSFLLCARCSRSCASLQSCCSKESSRSGCDDCCYCAFVLSLARSCAPDDEGIAAKAAEELRGGCAAGP